MKKKLLSNVITVTFTVALSLLCVSIPIFATDTTDLAQTSDLDASESTSYETSLEESVSQSIADSLYESASNEAMKEYKQETKPVLHIVGITAIVCVVLLILLTVKSEKKK